MRINFLNWRPDLDDFGHDGLSVADNVVHEPEGYKPIHLASSGSFATAGGLAATAATILSLVAKPVGSQGDLFCAWIANATLPTLHVGINGVTAATTATGYPLQFATAGSGTAIYAFDVCEYAGKIVWTVEAKQVEAGGTETSAAFAGHMDY